MWKRILGSFVAILFYGAGAPFIAPALAACGVDPPIPAEGLAWPANGAVSNPWSLDCAKDSGHRGIDIDVPRDSPITASAAGLVIFTGYTPAEGGGTTVSLEHPGGLRTTYLHLTGLEVSEGQYVRQGQLLGKSDGKPLHFGLKVAGGRELYFNPNDFLPPPVSAPAGTAEPVPEPVTDPVTAPGQTPPDLTAAESAAVSKGAETVAATAPSPAGAGAGAAVAAAPPAQPAGNAVTAGATSTTSPALGTNDSSHPVPALPGFGSGAADFTGHKPQAVTGNPKSRGKQAGVTADGNGQGINVLETIAGAIPITGYGTGLSGLVLLVVFAGRGLGRMAGKPVNC